MNTIESFVSHLQNEVRKSPHTVSSYKRSIEVLKDYCDRLQITNWNIDKSQAHAFVDDCIDAGMSATSVNTTLAGVRSFYSWCIDTGQLDLACNPFHKIVMPTVKRRVSPDDLLDREQVETLLDVQGDDALAMRDKAILRTLYAAGIRLSELVNLDIQDNALEREDAFVRVRNGKGNKERHVRIGMNAVNVIQSWLAVRYQLARAGERALFVSRLGTRPSNRTVQALIRKRGQESLGIQTLTPHSLRRTFTIHFLAGGGDVFSLREFLGHSFLCTTEAYVCMGHGFRSQAYDRAFPQG